MKKLLLALFSLLPLLSFAQKKVEIVHANDLLFDERLGNGAKRLVGQVQFKQENTLLFCDSAYFYSNNTLDAYGRVRIKQGDSLDIYGDFLKYNGNTRQAELQRNVRLIQKGSVLNTDLLYYDLKTKIATYPNGGTIVSKQNTLVSKYGYFNSARQFFSFKNDVVLTHPEYTMTGDTLNYFTGSNTAVFLGPTTIKNKKYEIYCEGGWYNTDKDLAMFKKRARIVTEGREMKGDSIYFDRTADHGEAFGNVSINDTAQNMIVAGEYALHEGAKERSTVTGKAVLKQFYGKDTLYLHADTLRVVDEHPMIGRGRKQRPDTSITWRVFYAFPKVKFFREDIQGKCDSLVYSDKDSLMHLFGSPVLWSEDNQLTAEKMNIRMSSGEIKQLYMDKTAFIVSLEDTGKYNQIRGKEMTGYFVDNKLSRIFVEGNGQTIYFAKDKDKLIGVNRATCSNLIIYVKDNEVQKITFLKKPEATLFPMEDFTPKEFVLKDFNWRIAEKPLEISDIFRP